MRDMKEIGERLRETYEETARILKGSERRMFMAKIVESLGRGGQTYVERKLGWNRGTVRKGKHELETGIVCIDNFSARGRKRAEDHLPKLLDDIRDIVASQSQTDPTFRTSRLYTRLSAVAVRQALIEEKGYSDEALPSVETMASKLNTLRYNLKKVEKTKPQKK